MKIISDLGIQIPQVYLPKKGTDLTKWAVIACDQFTSQPEYWNEVEKIVGDSPSTLNLTFPEVYLEKPDGEERIGKIQASMRKYMQEGVLQPHDGFVYVERSVAGKTRKGIVVCLDLEAYDYNKGSSSLIRATEGTIVDRLPPRMKIREGALLELPHILVLIDDPNCTVIEPLGVAKSELEKLYDFDLMLESGHLTGYAVNREFETQVVGALRGLADTSAPAPPAGFASPRPVPASPPDNPTRSHAGFRGPAGPPAWSARQPRGCPGRLRPGACAGGLRGCRYQEPQGCSASEPPNIGAESRLTSGPMSSGKGDATCWIM